MTHQHGDNQEIRFNCRHCGSQLSAPLEFAGQSVQCPIENCGKQVQVPAAPAVGRAAPPKQSDAAARLREARMRALGLSPAPKGAQSKPSGSLVPLFVVLGLLLFAGVGTLAYFLGRGDRPPVSAAPRSAPQPAVRPVSSVPAEPSDGGPVSNEVVKVRPPRLQELTPEERKFFSEKWEKEIEEKRLQRQREFAALKERAEEGDLDAQIELADCYRNGDGCPADDDAARSWYAKAVGSGRPKAMLGLGLVEIDYDPQKAARLLFDAAEAFLLAGDSEQGRQAVEALARTGHRELVGQVMPLLTDGAAEPKSGTGWFCPGGYVITCFHVVSFRNHLYVESDTLERTRVEVFKRAPEHDLVVLKLEQPERAKQGIPFATGEPRLGQSVFTMGYPMISVMGKALKVTNGSVSSLSGINDNPRDIQISVPIQSGNSGGPIINLSGEVIGIASSKLNATQLARVTGDVAQNVNYAVKVPYLRALLGDSYVSPANVTPPADKALEVLVSEFQDSIVRVCAE